MSAYILEVNVREELSKIPPAEALFKLAHYIAIQNSGLSKINKPTSLDLWIIKGNVQVYNRLSKELVETGKIAPPN